MAIAVWVIGLAALPAASFSAPRTTLANYKHTRWTKEEGAPTGIRGIAQTTDGFLWLAAQEGVFRFDGVRFEQIAAPAAQAARGSRPISLAADAHGSLWVGYDQAGGIAVLRQGRLIDTHMPSPPPIIGDIQVDSSGTPWAGWGGFGNRLWRYTASQWRPVDAALGVPFGSLAYMFPSSKGVLLIGVSNPATHSNSIAALLPGARRFREQSVPNQFTTFAEDSAGQLWMSDVAGTRRFHIDAAGRITPDATTYPASHQVRPPIIRAARDGSIWGSTRGSGIFRIAPGAVPPSAVERYTSAQGLTSDFADTTLVDREGNIWIGTENGLDRFRQVDVVADATLPGPESLAALQLARGSDGTVYVNNKDGLYEIRANMEPKRRLRVDGREWQRFCAGQGGSVWLAHTGKAVRLMGTAMSSIPVPGPPAAILDCTEDPAGRFWMTGLKQVRWHDANGWHTIPTAPLGISDALEIANDPGGDVVINLEGTRLGRVVGTRITAISAQKLGIGYINGLSTGRHYVLVSGSAGLGSFHNGHFRLLDAARHPWATRLRDATESPSGDTWAFGAQGVVRVRTAALDYAFDHPGTPLAFQQFDVQDGLNGSIQHFGIRGPQIAAGADGRVWVATKSGLFRIEARRLPLNTTPPPVKITALVANGVSLRDPASVILPKGTRNVSISYTALSLSSPSRNHFRYKLEGMDDNWVDPETRRQAFYTNLGPGHYRFRVIAANNNGVWNRTGAELRFEIKPTFVQSPLFLLLCAAAGLASLVALYKLRVRYLSDRIRTRIEGQQAERERIAQDLHDTLLQSVQGLLLRFHGFMLRPEITPCTRQEMADVLDAAEAALVDGRNRVGGLRSGVTQSLPEQIAAFAEQLDLRDHPVAVAIQGAERAMVPSVQEEAIRIAFEALHNAARHARATRIHVTIRFDRDAFRIEVTDDGVGIEPEVLERGGRDGHYGLQGMRERAKRGGGSVTIRSGPGGTTVALCVPAKAAYLDPPKRSWLRLARWFRQWSGLG